MVQGFIRGTQISLGGCGYGGVSIWPIRPSIGIERGLDKFSV